MKNSHISNHNDFTECLSSFIKTPNKIFDHFLENTDSNITGISDELAAHKITDAIVSEIGDNQEYTPTIHVFDVESQLGESMNDSYKSLLSDTEHLTLCLYYLLDGSEISSCNGYYCSREAAMMMLSEFKANELIKHRSWHIEFHAIPKTEVLQSIHS